MEEVQDKISQTLALCKKGITYVFFFSLFVNLLMLTVPLFMLLVFDYVLTSFSANTLVFLSLIACFALIIMGALDIIRGYIMRRVAFWFENTLNSDALKKAVDQLILGNPYGTQSLTDLATIRQFLTSPAVFSLFDVPWMPLYIAVIFILHPILGIFAIIGALLLLTLGIINEFLSKTLLIKANKQAIINQKTIDLVMRNVEVLQAMGMTNNIIKKWKTHHLPVISLQEQSSDRTGILSAISKVLRLFLQLGVLAIGAYLVINEQLTAGGMIAASILLSRALAPAEQSIGLWRQLILVRQSFDRIKDHFNQQLRHTTGIKLPKPKGRLVLENITYALKGMPRAIIDDISFNLNKGEMLALVGPSGAGKSTLARLMVGVIKPTKGCARLNDADVYHWDRSEFGRYIGYLPQDIELFPGTIKENIARMGEPDDEKVLTATKLAGAHEFILQLPKAYDSEISITNNPLSGGQQQRIALARAYYGNPSFIVLDEPNSNLDAEGEKALFNSLATLRQQGITIVLITHHLPALKMVDKVALIAAGKLITAGPREQILRSMNEAARAKKQ
jgi:ATP-binding cassette, subfamily C, type I secretion system permease/ATPase